MYYVYSGSYKAYLVIQCRINTPCSATCEHLYKRNFSLTGAGLAHHITQNHPDSFFKNLSLTVLLPALFEQDGKLMPRKNIYFKDKIDREIEGILEIERQKGATSSDVSYSNQVNELVRLGIMVYKSREEPASFDLEGFRRDLIKKASGAREGTMILMTMITEMYLNSKGISPDGNLEELLSQNFTAMNNAEDEAESHHFISEEE